MNKTAETVQSEQIDNAKLMQAGFAQCALMPWLMPVARKAPVMAVATSLTSAVLSSVFSVLCLNAADILKGIVGA